ncbi:MAG TPA: NAD(P)H-hydrate epimerase [Bacteroidaceae bacterium]|nr:NAD(P)H-hydrate epimerase [Bacteroidaceae bacterium]
MKKIYSAQTTRLWDQATIEEKGISSVDLMEAAAEALTVFFTTQWNVHHPVIIFAGPGNNGGDGVAIARLLSNRGYLVKLYVFHLQGNISSDTSINIEKLPKEVDFSLIENIDEVHNVFSKLQELDFLYIPPYPIILDALFGSGLNRPLSGEYANIVSEINSLKTPIISIDIPSGLHCEDNSQFPLESIIKADMTLAIQRPKLAHLLESNQPYLGDVYTIPIGLSEKVESHLKAYIYWLEAEEVITTIKQLQNEYPTETWTSEIEAIVPPSSDSYSRLQAILEAAHSRQILIRYKDLYQIICCPDGMVYLYR